MIQTTLMAWTKVFTQRGIDDAEHDPQRIAVAFERVAGEVTAWPAPKHVLDLMPDKPRPYFHKLPAPELTPEQEMVEANRRSDIVARERERLAQLTKGQP
jgi:hypothetical protein